MASLEYENNYMARINNQKLRKTKAQKRLEEHHVDEKTIAKYNVEELDGEFKIYKRSSRDQAGMSMIFCVLNESMKDFSNLFQERQL